MNDQELAQTFLDDLTKLTKQYGLAIRACSCCVNMWLDRALDRPTFSDSSEAICEDIQWSPEHQRYVGRES